MRIIQYINIFWYCGLDLRNEPLSEFKLIYKPGVFRENKTELFRLDTLKYQRKFGGHLVYHCTIIITLNDTLPHIWLFDYWEKGLIFKKVKKF